MSRVESLLGAALWHVRGRLLAASVMGAAAAIAAVLLLGLSGWFLTAAAAAGAMGPTVAATFNFLLPSAAIRFLAIVRTLARYGERVFGHEAALRALADLRPRLFAAIAEGSPEGAFRLSIGESSARLVQDVEALQNRIIQRSGLWAAGAAVLAGVALCSFAGVSAAATFLFCAIAFGASGAVWARRVGERFSATSQESVGRLKERAAVLMSHAVEVRVFGMGGLASQELVALGAEASKAQLRRSVAEASASGLVAASGGLTCALVVASAQGAEPPLVALAALAVLAVFEVIGAAVRTEVDRSRIAVAAERLDGVLSFDDFGPRGALSGLEQGARIQIGERVYAPGDRLVIKGPSGVGKSSLLLALLALAPGRGVGVKINGCAPCSATRSLFAYAPQAPTIPADTVREALKLGHAPEQPCDDAALWEALDDACLADRVRSMPKGLDTWLGASGVRLSGGEAKRLALARAYLRPAPWLLLDEPTEGLDALVEKAVIERLDRRLGQTGQGLVLVSHSGAVDALGGAHLALDPPGVSAH